MQLSDAKAYVGKVCNIHWQDRLGNEMVTESTVYDATFVPMYGGYIVTDMDDIRIDRISAIKLAGTVETLERVAIGSLEREAVAA